MATARCSQVRDASTLQGRRAFAQCVLRLELAAESLGMETLVGEVVGGKRVFTFRDVDSNAQGETAYGDEGDIFADPIEAPRWAEKLSTQVAELQAQLAAMSTRFEMAMPSATSVRIVSEPPVVYTRN